MRKGLKIGTRIRQIYFYRVEDERLFVSVAKKFSSIRDKMLLKLHLLKYIGLRGINSFLTSLRKNCSILLVVNQQDSSLPPIIQRNY